MSARCAAPCPRSVVAVSLFTLSLCIAVAVPAAARADISADLGGPQFSQRVATEVVQRRAQVRALEACEGMRRTPQARPEAPPAVDWRRLPLSPPVGTAGPVPDGPHPCQGR